MESIILLSIYLKSDVIKHIFENLEPFLNIKEQDGIYFYRIMIILKAMFFLYAVESSFPKYVTWLILTTADAFIIYKYRPIATVLVVLQCLILLASSKRFMLFASMALICILSMNIKSCEFILDLNVTACLITYAFQIYCHEIQKLWTIITIMLFTGWYVCSLHTFSVKQLFLIVCFLFLSYIPLKPHNKHRYKVLYFYALVFIWYAYKFQVTNFHETKILTDNSKFHKKWGYYESTETPNNIEVKNSFKKFRNPVMMDIPRAKLVTKYMFDNLTSYRDFRENICRIDDVENENMIIMDKKFKSSNGLPFQEKTSSFRKLDNVPERGGDDERKGLELQFFEEKNDKLISMASTSHSKLRNDPEKPLLVDSELILRYISNLIQKAETKKKKRNEYKTIGKFNYLLVFNNREDKESLKNHKHPIYEPIKLSKYKQKGSVTTKELKDHSSLKRETKTMGVIIERKSNIKRKIIPNDPVRLSEYKQNGYVKRKEIKVDSNLKRKTNIMRATIKKKSKTMNPSGPRMLKFKTLTDIMRENNLKRQRTRLNKMKTYFKEPLKIMNNEQQSAKRKRGYSNNKAQNMFGVSKANMLKRAAYLESIELENYAKLYDLIEQHRGKYNFMKGSKRKFEKAKAETIVPKKGERN